MPTGDQPFTFGVWLELPPDTPLAGQGIIRLLAALLRTITACADVKVVIAVPSWTAAPLRDVLALEGVDVDAIELLVSRRRLPLLVRLRRLLATRAGRRRHDRASLPMRVLRRIWGWSWVRRIVRRLLATTSPILATLLVAIAAVGAVLLGPLAAIALLATRLIRAVPLARVMPAGLSGLVSSPRMMTLAAWMGGEVAAFEFEQLFRRARRRLDIDSWLVPLPGAMHAVGLPAPLVVAVPDLVYVDFPTLYPRPAVDVLDERVRLLTARAAAVVSYCGTVRDHHVVRHLGIPAERACVIPHAPMHASTECNDPGSRPRAAATLRNHFRAERGNWGSQATAYLVDFPFDEVDFLFVSSQLRAHKNYLNLVRAFALVLRRSRVPVKLFFTGRWEDDRWGVREFVTSQRLGLDVISVPELPPDVHGAFYQLAAVTVVPTLFEGGFPFPFTESMSVGTPVVMSAIPMTRETVPAQLRPLMLFDPYDPTDMAEKIVWALEHRDELRKAQQPFYARLCRRTWTDVAQEYLTLMRRLAHSARGESNRGAFAETHGDALTQRAGLP